MQVTAAPVSFFIYGGVSIDSVLNPAAILMLRLGVACFIPTPLSGVTVSSVEVAGGEVSDVVIVAQGDSINVQSGVCQALGNTADLHRTLVFSGFMSVNSSRGRYPCRKSLSENDDCLGNVDAALALRRGLSAPQPPPARALLLNLSIYTCLPISGTTPAAAIAAFASRISLLLNATSSNGSATNGANYSTSGYVWDAGMPLLEAALRAFANVSGNGTHGGSLYSALAYLPSQWEVMSP